MGLSLDGNVVFAAYLSLILPFIFISKCRIPRAEEEKEVRTIQSAKRKMQNFEEGEGFLSPFLFIFNHEITQISTRIHQRAGKGNEKSEHNRKGEGTESWI